MKWWNKQTRNGEGKFYGVRSIERPVDWGNPHDSFIKAVPSDLAQQGLVECDFIGESFVDEQVSLQSYHDDITNKEEHGIQMELERIHII